MSADDIIRLIASQYEVIDGILVDTDSRTEAPYCGSLKYKSFRFGGKTIIHHRLIFFIANGYLPKEIDHIDGNPLNNEPENLRAATHAENTRNRVKWAGTTAKLKGAYWCKRRQKFISQIRYNGVTTYLGQFDTAEEAHNLWAATAKTLYGEFFNRG